MDLVICPFAKCQDKSPESLEGFVTIIGKDLLVTLFPNLGGFPVVSVSSLPSFPSWETTKTGKVLGDGSYPIHPTALIFEKMVC